MGSRDLLPITWKRDASEEEYERARVGRVFNHRRPDRYPVAIVEAEKEAHILQAVQLAQEKNLRVSVRSGGHSWAAWSVRDNSILIDLGNYKQIQLDEKTGIVAVSPSTTGRMLNSMLREKGLLFPGGHCPDVGLGGFLLQGGMGWVCRGWGWACQYVKAIDVVTADGQQLRCDEQQNEDLFWAARGAGPGFPAIITRFYLQTKPLPTHIRSSTYVFSKKHFKIALDWVRSIAEAYDRDTELVCVGLSLPDYEDSVVLVNLTTFKKSDDDAITALQIAEDSVPSGYLEKNFARSTSLQQEYVQQAQANPERHRYCSDNAYIDNNSDVASVLEEAFTTLPSRKSFALWFAMAPSSRRPLPEMALSMQSDHYLAIYTIWETAEDDSRCQRWTRNVMSKIEPYSVGQYLGDSDFQVRNTKYWGEEQGKKLMQIREKWNPEGRVCGYLDSGDQSGVKGLRNRL
ncbi:Glucooligosaccharide oxidase [Melanomma pulvis-pyrius CBS 109.77]|uniref:Glucooligosaccharide oxidase n=1 Tax=Melanomma pulvis-pyrius CBS 109.77 TaxID=1314802 RepID=A0A6A6XQK7_9PLEO|nr:Glucooligosaccharide oxidase [Melanomma pulvis-pyrius CBS 109.77]